MTADSMTALPATRWTAADLRAVSAQTGAALPVIAASDVVPIAGERVVWDMWPVARADGATLQIDGRSFWFFLAAPRRDDPDLRHDVARIRLFSHGGDGWRDHGDTFPDGFTPGSREWSGSAVIDDDGETLTLYFTAAGRRDGPHSFEQRLFETRGRFRIVDGAPVTDRWSTPEESVAADDLFYARADQTAAVNGLIKGFRDPGYFRDPTTDTDYLLFVGSAADSGEPYDGVIGIARRDASGWSLLPPLVTAIGVNAELERPHILMHAGRYYLFWSTQRARFAPDGPSGPTGLYGMVAERIEGPWRPLNGTGLVAANPGAEPFQAYCWWVTGEWDVISFVDFADLQGRDPKTDQDARARCFGGTVAPWFRLRVEGDSVYPENLPSDGGSS